jgi:heat shock protein HtpX
LNGARRTIALSDPIDNAACRQVLNALADQLSWRSVVHLRQSAQTRVPLCLGWRKPRIVLPHDWRTWPVETLRAVIAHEMAHVKDRDILVMSIAATLAGAISFAARWALWGSMFGNRRDNGAGVLMIVVAITAPIAALLVQLAISRSREYKADAEGARLIGKPLYLARALEKLEKENRRKPLKFGNPASAGLWIVNPFSAGGLVRIFSTHPPTSERVARLRKMANDMGQF